MSNVVSLADRRAQQEAMPVLPPAIQEFVDSHAAVRQMLIDNEGALLVMVPADLLVVIEYILADGVEHFRDFFSRKENQV